LTFESTRVDPFFIGILLCLGAATGFLAGLLGIGGGMILVPFMLAILSSKTIPTGLGIKLAVATSLATIVFTSISSVRAHHKRGAVKWNIFKLLAPGIFLGSLLGAQWAARINAKYMGILFMAFLVFSATQMFLDRKPKPGRTLPGPVGGFASGGLIGVMSAFVGAGGGFASVPFMVWCNVAIHNAVATSAALGLPIAVAGTIGYLLVPTDPTAPAGTLGMVWLPAVACLAITSVMTAPLGAKAAHSLPTAKLKRVFAVMLYCLAAYMAYKVFYKV
jgi:uncharacterized protein